MKQEIFLRSETLRVMGNNMPFLEARSKPLPRDFGMENLRKLSGTTIILIQYYGANMMNMSCKKKIEFSVVER